MKHVHGESVHALQDDGYFSCKGFKDKGPSRQRRPDKPWWLLDQETEDYVAFKGQDAEVRIRRLMGYSGPEGPENGMTWEEREALEADLDRLMEEEGASLSELTHDRKLNGQEHAAGFREPAQSRKFMEPTKDERITLKARELREILDEGGDIPAEAANELLMRIAIEQCESKSPHTRARGAKMLADLLGKGTRGAARDNAAQEFGI